MLQITIDNIDNQWCLRIPKGGNVALCHLSEETTYYIITVEHWHLGPKKFMSYLFTKNLIYLTYWPFCVFGVSLWKILLQRVQVRVAMYPSPHMVHLLSVTIRREIIFSWLYITCHKMSGLNKSEIYLVWHEASISILT